MSAFAAVVLAVVMMAPGQAGQDARAEAERLAKTGAHEEALKRFQQLVAANPDDVDSRLWIGRLHLSMGHPVRAAAVFESIVATSPQNVDALVGLALAEMDAGHTARAADALSRAEALAADRIDVLAAQGRYHAAEGRPTLALAYYGRALVAEPGNDAIRAASDAVRASRAHSVSVGYDFQKFDGVDDAMHAETVTGNFRVNDMLRVLGRVQLLQFGVTDDARFGAGIEWFATPSLHLRAGALAGSDNVWLPETDVFADATFLQRRSRWSLTVQYVDFDHSNLWIGGPGLELDVTPRITLLAQYLRGRTQVEFGDSTTSNNGMVGVAVKLTDRVRGSVSYARGIDRLDWLTVDRLGAEGANTLSAGIGADLTPFVSLSAEYDHHDRPAGALDANRGRAWLTFRF